MKHTRVEEIWISSDSSRYSTIDETYYPQWEHLRDQHYLGFVTIYIKTIEENNETQDNYRRVYAG